MFSPLRGRPSHDGLPEVVPCRVLFFDQLDLPGAIHLFNCFSRRIASFMLRGNDGEELAARS
jgi:hypothetical protein